jgi:phosphatidylserine decarboxylase
MIAREGLREMLISTAALGGAGAACATGGAMVTGWAWAGAAVLWGLWLLSMAFFRDPRRAIPTGAGLLVSPADGRVTEIQRLEACEGIEGKALRIGIFLSVFNVHINRVPCAGRVVKVEHRPGEFLDARHPECGARNESTTILLEPSEGPGGAVIVRQVAGRIARRIVCHLRPGQQVERGERFGLIKFGSRTEVIVPADAGLEPAVRVGDTVRGGSTVLMVAAGTRRSGEPARRRVAAA